MSGGDGEEGYNGYLRLRNVYVFWLVVFVWRLEFRLLIEWYYLFSRFLYGVLIILLEEFSFLFFLFEVFIRIVDFGRLRFSMFFLIRL